MRIDFLITICWFTYNECNLKFEESSRIYIEYNFRNQNDFVKILQNSTKIMMKIVRKQ